jgi:hypothetical protein
MGMDYVEATISHRLHGDRQVFLLLETWVTVTGSQWVVDGLDEV